MSPKPPFELPPAFSEAITKLPDGETRRRRAAACILEAEFWSQEIAMLEAGDVALTSPWSPTTSPAGEGVCGQVARVVPLDRATTADLEDVRDHLTAGFREVGPSDVDDAVAALSAIGGTKLRAHDVCAPAGIRAAKATADADPRPRSRREEPCAGGSP